MNVTMEPKAEHWRGRGAPRKHVPPQIKQLADATYRTGNIGRAEITADEEEEARELTSLLRSYANGRGLRMRIQRDDDVILFEMVDREQPKRGPKNEHPGRGSRGAGRGAPTGDAA